MRKKSTRLPPTGIMEYACQKRRARSEHGRDPAERPRPRPLPVRFHDRLALPVSGLHHRPGELSRRARGAVAVDGPTSLPRHLSVLAEGVRRRFRHGRRFRRRPIVPDRHQLVGLRRPDGSRARAALRLRSARRLLPGVRLPGHHAVRPEAGRAWSAFPGHLPCRGRDGHVGILDPISEFLDADPGRIFDRAGRPLCAGKLACDRLQPVVPLSLRPHRDGGLPHHRDDRRRRRSLAPAPRLPQCQRAGDVFHGDVDGDARGAAPARRRRPARRQHL